MTINRYFVAIFLHFSPQIVRDVEDVTFELATSRRHYDSPHRVDAQQWGETRVRATVRGILRIRSRPDLDIFIAWQIRLLGRAIILSNIFAYFT